MCDLTQFYSDLLARMLLPKYLDLKDLKDLVDTSKSIAAFSKHIRGHTMLKEVTTHVDSCNLLFSVGLHTNVKPTEVAKAIEVVRERPVEEFLLKKNPLIYNEIIQLSQEIIKRTPEDEAGRDRITEAAALIQKSEVISCFTSAETDDAEDNNILEVSRDVVLTTLDNMCVFAADVVIAAKMMSPIRKDETADEGRAG